MTHKIWNEMWVLPLIQVSLLDGIFAHGSAYCMGTINRDCWYLYTLNPPDRYVTGAFDAEPDQTIEILMTELDPEVMKVHGHEDIKVNIFT